MSRWKVLVATPFLLIPLGFASGSFGDGIEHHESRPVVVLPSLVEGPQVTMRPAAPEKPGPDKAGPDGPGPGPSRDDELTCTQDDDEDDDQDDDRYDDEVEVVQPCPDAVGDDDDDDRDDGDDGDDGDDADGDD